MSVEIDGQKESRYSLTTINDHHILIVFSGAGAPKVYADKDIDKLLKKANA